MLLKHPLVPGFVSLRHGEERDRQYLAGIFSEVWAAIPAADQWEIRLRGAGKLVVDVLAVVGKPSRALDGASNIGGWIGLQRRAVDSYSRRKVLHIVAHELAHKLDDATSGCGRELSACEHQVEQILERWGLPTCVEMGCSRRARSLNASRFSLPQSSTPGAGTQDSSERCSKCGNSAQLENGHCVTCSARAAATPERTASGWNDNA